jgi:putative FmdB family regulatory protein
VKWDISADFIWNEQVGSLGQGVIFGNPKSFEIRTTMPIYEFFCKQCNTIFNFFSRRVNTGTIPACPKCGRELKKMLSSFATVGKAVEPGDKDLAQGFDESRMEKALGELAREADKMNEEDPKAMAGLMRRFAEKTGLALNENMEKALSRLEAGEDPEQIEKEMGDILEGDDTLPFDFKQSRSGGGRPKPPVHDETLYEMES